MVKTVKAPDAIGGRTRGIRICALAGAALAAILGGWAATASAEPLHGRIALGPGYLPDYEGSNDYGFVPYPEIQVYDGNYFVEFTGGALRFNVLDDAAFHAGPLIGFVRSRKDVDDPQVRRMHHLDSAFTTGGFVEYQHQAKDPRSGEKVTLSLKQGFAGADAGLTITARGMVHRPIKFVDPGLIGTVEIDTTWANAQYMHTYFDVNPADAAASGLPVFRARSGMHDAGVALALDQFFSRRVSVGVRVHYSRLLGDSADSPVTAIAGSPNQFFVGLVVGYRFGKAGGL